MVKANRNKYSCSNCSEQFASWSGKCSSCGAWNTLELNSNLGATNLEGHILDPKLLTSVETNFNESLHSRVKEINNLFGDGIVKGSIILLAGAPGVGKSTFLLQLIDQMNSTSKVLYISAEESLNQIYLRAKRLGIDGKIMLASTNSTDDIAETIHKSDYDLVIIDSIQTIKLKSVSSSSGSVSQITNSTILISEVAKQKNCAVILVGHITKEGAIAGPKVLEHLVDVVLQFEGDRYGGLKVLKALKNRYGSIDQVIILEMTEKGLQVADNPSKSLLKERLVRDGSIVHPTMEGNRPILVEIQALVATTKFGYPKRTASGFDLNRLNLLIAVLDKRTKLNLLDKDIFINVVGGLNLKEPAADLAVAMAIASAATNTKLINDLVVFGEVGLSGEIRHVPFIQNRLTEALNLGFKGAIGPELAGLQNNNYYPVKDIRNVLIKFLDK